MIDNLITCLVVVGLIVVVVRAGREPLWAEAYRRLRRNAAAMAALVVIVLFLLLGGVQRQYWLVVG